MKKTGWKPIFLTLVAVTAVSVWAADRITRSSGATEARGQSAVAGAELVKFFPRSTKLVFVLDVRKLMAIDPIAKALKDPKAKQGYDEFVQSIGIDPGMDVNYVGIRGPAFGDPSSFSKPMSEAYKDFCVVINLKYDQARIRGLIKDKLPKAKEETYHGVPVFSELGGEPAPAMPFVLAELERMSFELAFLDASHILFGTDLGIKDVVDVCQGRTEALSSEPDMAFLISQADKSGVAWAALPVPAELFLQAAEVNPQLKGFGGFKGAILALDDKGSTLMADIRYLGGNKEQNDAFAANLNAIKFLAGMSADQEPALANLVSGIVITSGEDYTRATLTVSHETIGKLWQLAESKGAGTEASCWEIEALKSEGDFQRASEVGKQALEETERTLGPDHPDVAAVSSSLAGAYAAQGRFKEAEELDKRALAIVEKAVGPDHPDVVKSLNDLAGLYRAQGRHAAAEPLLKRALAIREKAFGPDDLQVAESLDELATFYYTWDRQSLAEPLFKRCLAIREKALGPDGYDVALTLESLARLYQATGRLKDAEDCWARAERIRAIKR